MGEDATDVTQAHADQGEGVQESDAVKIARVAARAEGRSTRLTALVALVVPVIYIGGECAVAASYTPVPFTPNADSIIEDITDTMPQPADSFEPLQPSSTLHAYLAYGDDEDQDPSEAVLADFCVLTRVASYGGTTKSCMLTRTDEGIWVLIASRRGASVTCQATCFGGS